MLRIGVFNSTEFQGFVKLTLEFRARHFYERNGVQQALDEPEALFLRGRCYTHRIGVCNSTELKGFVKLNFEFIEP